MSETKFVAIAKADEIGEGEKKCLDVEGTPILVCRSGDTLFAVHNECSHALQRLDEGRVRRGWISCPLHGARFDLETGEALGPPASEPIKTYEVRVSGDTIEVALPT